MSADIGLLRELLQLRAPIRRLSLSDRCLHYECAERAFGWPAGQPIEVNGHHAEWVLARRSPWQPVLLYLHGGGYCMGSSRSHRHLAAAIGRAAGVAVLSLDYRLAPEHTFPAAVHDAAAAVGWLTARTQGPILLAGDSAGGGLALAAMLALRDRGERLPCACLCLSPWADLTCKSDAYTRLATRDPLLAPDDLSKMADHYLRGADPRDPLASPVYGRLHDLPPLLIQVGTEEILLDDARAIARAAGEQGVDATLQEWSEMMHVWQWYHPLLEQGRRAIDSAGEFLSAHAQLERGSASKVSRESQVRAAGRREPKAAPVSPIQEAHLRVAPWTSGGGYLSWVYQLNGPLDVSALARACDDVVCRHEVLRTRFEHRGGRLLQVVSPFRAGALKLVDLAGVGKRQALETAVADARALQDSLRPLEDSRFRATLHTIDRKTSVLAMFVAEALVDSDSGELLSAEITRAYAQHSGTMVSADLPEASQASYLDYTVSHPADPLALRLAREHWLDQAREASPGPVWPVGAEESGSALAFQMVPPEWERAAQAARALGATPYIFVLACLQLALFRALGLNRFQAHSIVCTRDRGGTRAMIGNFHSLVRIDLRLCRGDTLRSAIGGVSRAVAETIEHRVLPAPLADPSLLRVSSESLAGPDAQLRRDPFGDIRFYMFSSHTGPVFAGVRRRRFRLHGRSLAPLSLSCIYGPSGRQDFVLSSTLVSHAWLERVAAELRAAIAKASGLASIVPSHEDGAADRRVGSRRQALVS